MVKEIKTLDEFSKIIADENFDFVVIDFYANWCGPCKQIAPEVDKLATKYNNGAFYKINIENENMDQVCQIMKIKSLPTFCLFKNGNYITCTVGADIAKLEQMISK